MKFSEFSAFPTVHWSHNWERQHELIYRMSQYFQSVYIHPPYGLINYHFGEMVKKIISYHRQERLSSPTHLINPLNDNFTFVRHPFVPIHYHPVWDRINYYLLRRASVPPETAVIYAGYCNAFMLKYFKLGGYRWIDLFARRQVSSQLSRHAKNVERAAVESADLVTVDNLMTLQDYQKYRSDIIYLPQGVDVGRFFPTGGMEEIAKISRRYKGIAGYMGTDLVVDTALFEGVITRCRDVLFVLIGAFKDDKLGSFKKFSNVYFTGRLDYFQLNKAVNSIDIGLIPYQINDRTSGVFPTKYYEYLACNKPVITTPLPDLADKESAHMRVVRSVDEFARAIYELIEGGFDSYAPLAEALENTWPKRIEVVKQEFLKSNILRD